MNKITLVQKLTWKNINTNGDLRMKTDSHGKHEMASSDGYFLLMGNDILSICGTYGIIVGLISLI